MRFVAVERHPDNVRAHADPDVLTTVDRLMRFPSDGMVRLLAHTLYSGYAYGPAAVRHHLSRETIDQSEIGAAEELAAAALRISNKSSPDKQLCRGAVVEAVTERLIRHRRPEPDVQVEERIGDLRWYPGQLSPPFDVLVHSEPLEVYEAKSDPWTIDQNDLDAMRSIIELADEEWLDTGPDGRRTVVGFTTLAARLVLSSSLDELVRPTVPLWAATLEDISMLASEPAHHKI